MSQSVFLLGSSGKVARHAAPVFEAAGWTVRRYDRSQGDMAAQAKGADVIINGLNPPNYHDWAGIIPQITEQVIDAARATGATVIVPGNVYVFGDTPGMWSETTAHRPITRKGRVRAQMERAYQASGVQVINLRAGDFIAAQPNDSDLMGAVHMKSIHRGRLTTLGDPDALHAYGYLPDWARAALGLAHRRADLPQFTDVHLGGANFTMTQMRDALSDAMGRPIRLSQFPWPLMRATAPLWELAREMVEMRYLWSVSHGLDDSRLRALLPEFRPTDLRQVMLAAVPRDLMVDQAA